MKRILTRLILTAGILAAMRAPAQAGLYYDLQQSASSATMRLVGIIKLAATGSPYVPTITLDGATGYLTATTFFGNLATSYLTGTISASQIASDAVTTVKILDANVTTAKIASGAVDTTKLASDAVTTAKILNGNVTNAKLADGSVDTAKLATDAVTSAKILDGTIATADIANGAVDTTKLATDAVTTAKILNANVTNAKLADGSVDTAKLASNSVTVAKLYPTANTANGLVQTDSSNKLPALDGSALTNIAGAVSGGTNGYNVRWTGSTTVGVGPFITTTSSETVPSGNTLGVASGGLFKSSGTVHIAAGSAYVGSAGTDVVGAWSSWTPTVTGFSANPTGLTGKYIQIGKLVIASFSTSGAGTSNSTAFTVSLPVAALSAGYAGVQSYTLDNSAAVTGFGQVATSAGSATATLYVGMGNNWTASGLKNAYFTVIYEAQ